MEEVSDFYDGDGGVISIARPGASPGPRTECGIKRRPRVFAPGYTHIHSCQTKHSWGRSKNVRLCAGPEIRSPRIPSRCGQQAGKSQTGISTPYREFTDALTEVLAENAVGPARRGRLARARAAIKKHPEYSEHAYFLAVESVFTNWEAMQNASPSDRPRCDDTSVPART